MSKFVALMIAIMCFIGAFLGFYQAGYDRGYEQGREDMAAVFNAKVENHPEKLFPDFYAWNRSRKQKEVPHE